jgi:hypothetical protein
MLQTPLMDEVHRSGFDKAEDAAQMSALPDMVNVCVISELVANVYLAAWQA